MWGEHAVIHRSDARIVHQDIELPIFLSHLSKQRLHRVLVGHVDTEMLIFGMIESRLTSTTAHHAKTGIEIVFGKAASNALASTRNQHDLITAHRAAPSAIPARSRPM